MSIFTFPSTLAITTMTWGQQRRDATYSSAFGSQAVEVSPPLWAVAIHAPAMKEIESNAWKGLMMQLQGRVNQLELWDMVRAAPQGTMRGTMTLNSAAAQGDVTLSIIAGTEAFKTLLTGDLLGLGSGITQQVVMVVNDATADGSGIIAVTVQPPLRNAFSGGAGVTWDKPKALFRQMQSKTQWDYTGAMMVSGFMLDLLEDWRA